MDLVRRIRVKVGIKQIDLANKLGINPPNYNKIESGKYFPSNVQEIEDRALSMLEQSLLDLTEKTSEDLKEIKGLSKELKKLKAKR